MSSSTRNDSSHSPARTDNSKEFGHPGSRRFLLIFIVLLLLLISIGFVRDGILRGRAKSGPVSKSSELKTTSLRIISTPSPVAAPALLETNAPIESSSSLREKADFFRLGPPPSGVIYIFGNTGAVAVIDFTRIAKALALPTIPGEKAPKIATVRDAVAAVRSHIIWHLSSTAPR